MVRRASGFVPSGFFVLRTPLLPFDELLRWGERVHDSTALAHPSGAETDDQDRERLRLHLRDLLARPEILEALFVASPDLVRAIDHWRDDANSKRGRKVETSLTRYFLRMAGRPTPFGLFAGYSLGHIDSKTELVIENGSQYCRHTRVDMEYLCTLVTSLERNVKLRQKFIHRPNSTLYDAAGRVRYVETRSGVNTRIYRLVAIEPNKLLKTAVWLARDGIYPVQLAKALSETEANLSLTDACDFVNELIESQILASDLNPTITGTEPVESLLSKLESHEETAEISSRLKRCVAGLRELDNKGLGNAPADYEPIAKDLAAINPASDCRRLLQVDLMKPAPHASLSDDVITEISKAVDVLRQTWSAPRRDLSLFRAAFLERYGERREVPLVETLDPDIGIAFSLSSTMSPDAFVKITSLPSEERSEQDRSWTRRDTHLLKLITRSLMDGSDEIMLNEHDLEELRAEFPLPLPDAFAVQVSIAAASETDLARGRFRVSIRNVQGPSGARSFGRFCHFDDLLLQRTREHIHCEESLRPGALFAEIVHLPTGRTGNVLLRPQLRDYEIPYLGGSGNPVSQQIPLTDLYVTVIDGRIVLRSISLQREVIPRLTAAHYYYGLSGLNVYRFLCLLQDQGQASEIEWDWGLAVHSPFLPRVSFRRLVLSRARWNMSAKELHRLRNVSRSESIRIIQEWRTERKWPRWVALVDDDNELPINLDNVLCNDTLAEILKGVESAQLVEVFPTPDELCVRGAEGRFAHEIIVPFVGVRSSTEVHSGNSTASTSAVKRSFAPGSEWLYFKLYTGESTADQLLREFVRPFVEDALHSGDADQWFFIRYGDPFWHIRLRFHGVPDRLHTTLLSALTAAVDPLISAGKVWRMQIDTYEREIERYGGFEGILLAEKIFQADSEAVLTIIESLAGNEGTEPRRLITLRSIDLLLDSFALDLSSKSQVMEMLCDEFGGPLAATPGFRSRVGTTYRRVHETIENAIDGTREMQARFAREFAALDQRSQQTSSVIGRLKACAEAGLLAVPLAKLISSFVHLHANRILRPASPGEELFLYHLLARFYRSRIARVRT